MRLLHVQTRKLEEFSGDNIPPYAILSHTWGTHELTFQDLSKLDHENFVEYPKVEGCCQQAANDGFSYVWIDTCCIDKSSSAELSEGINSMFQWYKKSAICYVYLADVVAEDDLFEDGSEFRTSRWFTRGWTLQELLAPMAVAFFDYAWNELVITRLNRLPRQYRVRNPNDIYDQGYLNDPTFLTLLAEITSIPEKALDTGDFSRFCAAARLAWAADRNTTRVEDKAYSLLGLLEVNMPLLYGEGNKAFQRLQEEVIKSRDDDSLLAWGYRLISKVHPTIHIDSVLAQSPSDFRHCHSFRRVESEGASPEISLTTSHSAMTNIGMQMAIPVRAVDSRNGTFIAILKGRIAVDIHGLDGPACHLVVPLVRTEGGDKNHFSRAPGSPPFLVRRAKIFSILQSSKRFFLLGRMPLLWKLLITKPLPTPIYLREHPITTPPRGTWPKLQKESETMNLHIHEVTSMGYEIMSFYPPWITGRPGNRNSLVLRLDSKSTRYIIIFSKPKRLSNENISFAVCIGLGTYTIARVDHGSALEYLMEQSRLLEVNTVRHNIHQEKLQILEQDEHGRYVEKISFQYMFGDVRIKYAVNHTCYEAASIDLKGELNNNNSEEETINTSREIPRENIGMAL